MTILRTTLAITGLALCSVSLQAAFMTEANVVGGTNSSSYARAQDGVISGGSFENFACTGGTSTAGGTSPTNSVAAATCEFGREFASADLATGALRAFAFTDGSNAGTTAGANAQWADEVTFNNSTGSAVLLGVSYRTHAAFTGETGSATTSLLSNLLFSQPGGSPSITFQGGILHGLRFVYTNGSASIQDPNAGGPPSLGGWTVTPVGPVGALFSGALVVPSGLSTLDIATILRVNCTLGADCDASNTAGFSFGALPTGLSYTSSSGAFLTGAATGVPEPGTWVMLSAGLLTIGFLRCRKNGGFRSTAASTVGATFCERVASSK
jgi:hypothetical protein